METLQSTALRLRDAAIENINKYCKDNKCEEEFDDIKNHLMTKSDPFNIKLPVDMYKEFYNESLDLLKQ